MKIHDGEQVLIFGNEDGRVMLEAITTSVEGLDKQVRDAISLGKTVLVQGETGELAMVVSNE